ncbi:unnamed protein product [Pneumocystis jirovecii]|uniref:Uncharacterized protein n=1 Tax=Pneumocystis jirovecii TaxID=42068 RepID=L0PED6_PNEJI|nr:unnamed protein product [Pneumocystis jirovecii]
MFIYGSNSIIVCCIYHKPREYDESSSDTDTSSSESENHKNSYPNNYECFGRDMEPNCGNPQLYDKVNKHLNAYETYPKNRKTS